MVYVNSPLRQPSQAAHTTPGASRRSTAATSTVSTASTSTAAFANTAAPDFRALFAGSPASTEAAPPAQSSPPPPPTAQSVFGANPWMTNPGGKAPNGLTYNYNPVYFATPETAAKVAQMVGGKVVETNAITPLGPFQQNQPNEMVQLANGRMINAGIIASLYDHGYSQQYVDKLVANEVNDTTN